MSYRGGGSGGGPVGGGFKRQGRSSPYAHNGGSGGGGNRRSWGNQSNRKGHSSDGTDGRTDYEQSPSRQDVPIVKKEAPPPQPEQEVNPPHAEPVLQVPNEATSANNSMNMSMDTPRTEKKSYVKSRLFVGNLPREMRENRVKEMFEEHGEVSEVFVQKEKGFGFVRMVYRSDAEKAVAAFNGKVILGREIKVRFAASNSSVKVTNLHPTVSNELLEEAFSQFGEVEKAVVVTDERGKSLGHGIVDFSRKAYAQGAIRRCTHEHFLLTHSPMPVVAAEYIRDNDDDGQPEKTIPKNAIYRAERGEAVPRFAEHGSLEYAVASQWKSTYESEKRQRDELEQQLRQSRNAVLQDVEALKDQHQTELIRQELAHHQQEQLRLVQELRMRQGSFGNMAAPGGSFMEGPGGNPGAVPPGFPPMPGMEMNQQDMRNQPLYENPPLLAGGPGAGPGLMGMGAGGPPAVPLHPGAPPTSGTDTVPTSVPQGMSMVPPPPLMGQWPGANYGTPSSH